MYTFSMDERFSPADLVKNYPALSDEFAQKWYTFWHVVFVGSFVVALGAHLWTTRAAWGWGELAVAVATGLQIFLYVRFNITAEQWPAAWLWVLYFVAHTALWAVELLVSDSFFWLIFPYTGYVVGSVPIKAGVPIILTLFFTLSAVFSWQQGEPGFVGRTGRIFLEVLRDNVWFFLLYAYVYQVKSTSGERAHYIRELQAAHEELEKARQQEAELAVLRERERLAREMHDGLGHTLAALSMQLEAIQRLYRVDPARASAQVDEMKRLTRESMGELRRSLEGLRSPGLDGRSLSYALHTLAAERRRRAGLTISCDVAETAGELGESVAEALWRVAQEALTNVEKHAQASRVSISLARQPQAVVLRVQDNGVGITAADQERPGHYGLRGMGERLEGLGGTLAVRRLAEGGTLVEARLPLIAATADPLETP